MSQWNSSSLDSPRVFYLAEGSTLADIGEALSRIEADEFRSASSFAFLSRTQIVFDATSAVPALNYAAGKPIVLLSPNSNFTINTELLSSAGFAQLEIGDVIPKVRNADCLQLLHANSTNCFIESQGNYHFVTPALIHTTRFIRVADLLHDLATLDRLSFWLRPIIGHANAILADSWGISSLFFRALQLENLNLPFVCLPEHPTHNTLGCRATLDRLLLQIPPDGKLVAFVSISGSGTLARHLRQLLAERMSSGLQFECWGIFSYEEPATSTLTGSFAQLPQGEAYSDDSCKLCKQGSTAVRIDPVAYHPKSMHEPVVFLSKTHAQLGKSFVERYRDVPALFRVHHDDRNDGRHHAFDLDMLALISNQTFQERLTSRLTCLQGEVDLVIVPNHEPGKLLAQQIANKLHCPFIVHDSLERASLSQPHGQSLERARKLLIVDDVVNSGSRLKQYIQSVREGHYGQFESFNYLVAVARPASPQSLRAFSKLLAGGHTWKGDFYAVEEMVLPSWGKDQCPWCLEFDFLSRVSREFGRPPRWLSKRVAKLRDTSIGLMDEPLLLLPGVPPVVMGSESPICPGGVSPMIATFVIASALQFLRWDSDPRKQLHPGFPVGNVMHPENVSDRFTESLIRAILLRLVRRAEWGQVRAVETRDTLLRDVSQENQRVLGGELLFSLGRRALPPISRAGFEEVFGGLLGTDDTFDHFCRVASVTT